jgi:oleate hydratase
LLKGARALNNNEPFPGERLLHRLLDNTYYAHILPPLPAEEDTLRERAEVELSALLGKGSRALGAAGGWIDRLRDGLHNPSK